MTTKKKTKRANTSDQATKYAKAVLSGKIITGQPVKNACKRHLSDLKEQKKRGIYYDKEEAAKAIRYFSNVLRLAGGEFEGAPFVPNGWQAFIICSIFGWKWKDTGYRRFAIVYVETGKGSGKSPLAAGIGLKMLASDDEARAEVYAAATKRDQAMILFRDAIAMYEQSPELRKRLKTTGAKGREWNLYYSSTGSFFRPIGSENTGKGQSGVRPHCNLIDEVHEHPTNAMIEFMSAGKKGRRQALDFLITNSGHDRKSVCFEYHEYAIKICDPDDPTEDDSFFGYVCSLDEGDDPFKDESCWLKANPSLPETPTYDYLRRQVAAAKGMPSKESIVRRLNFCEWVDAADPWISRDSWDSCVSAMELPEDNLDCVAAIDLSGKTDLTALSLEFELEEVVKFTTEIDGEETVSEKNKKICFNWYWTPKDTLRERETKDRTPYAKWVDQGYLNAIDGKSIDYAFVAQQIKTLSQKYNIKILTFDRYRISDLIRELDEIDVECYLAKVDVDDKGREKVVAEDGRARGIAMLPHGQGFKDMSPAVEEIEEDILNEVIKIQKNPVTTMCAANAVLQTDPAGGRKFTKQKSTGRIDGMITISMANRVIRLIDSLGDQKSIYETRGVIAID